MRLAFVAMEESEIPLLRRRFSRAHFSSSLDTVPDPDRLEALGIFIYTPLPASILQRFPALKYIVTFSTGFDHIDTGYCRRRGIEVYNIPDYGTETVAEYTFLLMLALLRRLRHCESALRELAPVSPSQLRGWNLHGKTLGIIGAGRIGSYVARLAHAFGMRILACDSVRPPHLTQMYGVEFVPLLALLRQAGIITLHVPLTAKTRHLLNRRAFNRMKRGVFIVNTARGGLIDTAALAQALESGRVAGAALDVIEGEHLLANQRALLHGKLPIDQMRAAFVGNALLHDNRVLLTPHIAYNTYEALRTITRRGIETLEQLGKGQARLSNRVI